MYKVTYKDVTTQKHYTDTLDNWGEVTDLVANPFFVIIALNLIA